MSESEKANGRIDADEPFVLRDAEGPIPTFGPAKLDEHGRLLPISDEEQKARADAVRRMFAVWDTIPDDPPGLWEEAMRNLDAGRPPGAKKFEGIIDP